MFIASTEVGTERHADMVGIAGIVTLIYRQVGKKTSLWRLAGALNVFVALWLPLMVVLLFGGSSMIRILFGVNLHGDAETLALFFSVFMISAIWMVFGLVPAKTEEGKEKSLKKSIRETAHDTLARSIRQHGFLRR